ncbi:MAG: GNAT family N-acetyltransferase [Deltaproteobacteria bacterium]|nr:GNAT family N-acetyltransferase [Deltaproteobacteria bacterium]
MELIFQEGSYLIKTLSTHEEMEAAFRLRHEVFVDELKWVPASPDGMEKDGYDAFAHPIGVFDEWNKLIGYVRLIPAPQPFMIEKEFACLLPKDMPFRKLSSMAESTRICIQKEYRTTLLDSSLTLGHLLYKAIYQWCLMEDKRFFVTIVEKRYHRFLKYFFPFEPLGDFLPLGDGVLSGIVLMDWRNFEALAKEKRPDFFQWMTNLPSLVPSQWLQHAP